MATLWLLQEPWLRLAESVGGSGFATACLALALVCVVVWHVAFAYFKFGAMEKGLVEVRQQMVTRDSFALALKEMEMRLNHWADERFLTRSECQALMESRERFARGGDRD